MQRLLEILPGGLALFLISTLIWGFVWLPAEMAIGLLIFDVYWLWKSWTIAFHVMKGVRLMRRAQAMDWRAEYRLATERGLPVLPWTDVRHVVIIPNYKESVEKLRLTLLAMAQCAGARDNVIPVLAMEEGELGARQKASILIREFGGAFHSLLVTYHPCNIPGEVRGKSSNEAWAGRCAVEELAGRRGMDIDNLTVTSCDADTLFPEQYFEALTYNFATDPARYRRFWQAPIFFYNNIWQVPAPLRIPNALSGLIHLSRLSRKRKVLFSQSTYTLSMRMAHDVGYWDTDIIPEDWHMFLKCFYRLGGNVDVKPIHLPIGNDGALSHTPKETYVNQYLQVQRWAWGAADTPYVLNHVFNRHDIPLQKRLLRFWYMFENHLSWSTQWFFITLGGFIPTMYGVITGDLLTPEWFYMDGLIGETFLPSWVTITTLILSPCMLCYLIIITTDRHLRPPAPPSLSTGRRAFAYIHWLLIPPITFFFSALPALDSQVRLMLGRRMEYRVTEKV
ncbi:MAG: hypothetical protein GEU75_03515 [Dehalococcoidia bacterium]|nr:hypothetical protein [Dehalococcoidia bacterium]